MDDVTKQCGHLANRSPEVFRLAALVSFAVLAEPGLIRRMRLHFLPQCDAGTEADLWFSPIVTSRSTEGIVFEAEAAEYLRRSLAAADADLYEAAWQETSRAHRDIAPALRLEEEICYLLHSRKNDRRERIRQLFRSAIVALVNPDRIGLAHWAARALPRFPDRIREMEEARMLSAGAGLRLTDGLTTTDLILAGQADEWLAWMAPASGQRYRAGVRLYPGLLEIGPAEQLPGSEIIDLPRTDPLVLEVGFVSETDTPMTETIQQGGPEVQVSYEKISFADGDVRLLAAPSHQVRLRTVIGEEYELATLEHGLHEALTGMDGERMVEELLRLAPRLKGDLLEKTLQAVQSISAAKPLADLLIALAPQVGGGEREKYLLLALETSQRIPNELERAHALTRLAPYLPKQFMAEVAQGVMAVKDEKVRARLLVQLAPYLPQKIDVTISPPEIGTQVPVPAGPFLSGDGKVEKKISSVYHMDAFPVTNSQFAAFIKDARGYFHEGNWSEDGLRWFRNRVEKPLGADHEAKADHPVVNVCFYEAEAYAEWARKRLPSEEEWEKAARGETGLKYPWGDQFDKDCCNTVEAMLGGTTPVNQYPLGQSPYGCFDMAGNVWEWTLTPHDRETMVTRGGAWDYNRNDARCARRFRVFPNYYSPDLGFRCLRPGDPDPDNRDRAKTARQNRTTVAKERRGRKKKRK